MRVREDSPPYGRGEGISGPDIDLALMGIDLLADVIVVTSDELARYTAGQLIRSRVRSGQASKLGSYSDAQPPESEVRHQ